MPVPFLVEVPYQAEVPYLVEDQPCQVEDHPNLVAVPCLLQVPYPVAALIPVEVPCQDADPFLEVLPFLILEVVPFLSLEVVPCLVEGPCQEVVQSSCLVEAPSCP